MTSRRTPLDRRRKPVIDDETLKLFVELERTPAGRRKSEAFSDRDYELHKMLGLWGERFASQVSVLDRGARTQPARTLEIAREAWRKCQDARNELLRLAEAHGLM
jgi:hypothetical protein